MVFEEAVVIHGIEATCASPNGIEAKCASPRWRPNPEIDWHRDRYPRDMINPAGRNHVIRQRSPSSNDQQSRCLFRLVSLPAARQDPKLFFHVIFRVSRAQFASTQAGKVESSESLSLFICPCFPSRGTNL